MKRVCRASNLKSFPIEADRVIQNRVLASLPNYQANILSNDNQTIGPHRFLVAINFRSSDNGFIFASRIMQTTFFFSFSLAMEINGKERSLSDRYPSRTERPNIGFSQRNEIVKRERKRLTIYLQSIFGTVYMHSEENMG